MRAQAIHLGTVRVRCSTTRESIEKHTKATKGRSFATCLLQTAAGPLASTHPVLQLPPGVDRRRHRRQLHGVRQHLLPQRHCLVRVPQQQILHGGRTEKRCRCHIKCMPATTDTAKKFSYYWLARQCCQFLAAQQCIALILIGSPTSNRSGYWVASDVAAPGCGPAAATAAPTSPGDMG